jgi:hypothetical protein
VLMRRDASFSLPMLRFCHLKFLEPSFFKGYIVVYSSKHFNSLVVWSNNWIISHLFH